jgi:hypothetical protein
VPRIVLNSPSQVQRPLVIRNTHLWTHTRFSNRFCSFTVDLHPESIRLGTLLVLNTHKTGGCGPRKRFPSCLQVINDLSEHSKICSVWNLQGGILQMGKASMRTRHEASLGLIHLYRACCTLAALPSINQHLPEHHMGSAITHPFCQTPLRRVVQYVSVRGMPAFRRSLVCSSATSCK